MAVRRKAGEPSSSRSPSAREQSADDGETAVERKRRLAVLATQADEEEGGETPAERRRREAALGMAAEGLVEESDSDDEGSERVPPAKRGIRFAEPTRHGR